MQQKEYFGLIEALENRLNTEDANDILEELKKISYIKPVRASWFVLKVEAMYRAGYSMHEIYEMMRGKVWAYYDYDAISKLFQIYEEFAQIRNDEIDRKRLLFHRSYLSEKEYEENKDYIASVENELLCALESFEKSGGSKENLICLTDNCYVREDYVPYMVFDCSQQKLYDGVARSRIGIKQNANMGYLLESIYAKSSDVFVILVTDELDAQYCKVLSDTLSMLNKTVFLIEKPVMVEVENRIHQEDILKMSIENAQICKNCTRIYPVELVYAGASQGDNRGSILKYISENYLQNGNAVMLCSEILMDILCQNKILQKQMGNLYAFQWHYYERNLTFGWLGNYLDYISTIYGVDCRKLVEKKSNKKFSIILPARNSSVTLRYTLKTCLEQTYTGDYEIIVSDNSTGHNADVYELCKELNDSRIVYLKTPRDLPLPKSFEYAYLHANGEYIFALGSDDGLLPWALETLDEVVEKYPEEEIIQWERGFYAWPGFNGGQQNQFTIPRAYHKGKYDIYYRDNIDYIAAVLNDPSSMYSLPMLYINSCFKRSYFKTLLEKTGRLWDGVCQDIYMGVITACIHSKILNLRYPLAIAGMSSGSVGASANTAKKTNAEFEKMMKEVRSDNNMGGFCASYYERLLPATGTDTSSLYGSLLRAVSIGILPESYLTEVFDWKKMFAKLASELDIRDVAFDRKIHEMRYAAMLHGEEFLQWFDENIYHPMLEPKYVDEEEVRMAESQRTYKTGKTAQGGLILDASEYGVSNIYDAVKLFVQMSGFYKK